MFMFVVLLRGINVGRNRRLPMADLRRILEQLGGGTVRTLLQSGNAVVTGTVAAERIADAVASEFGFRPDTVAVSAAQFRGVVDACPFELQPESALGGKAVHIYFAIDPVGDRSRGWFTFDLDAARRVAADGELIGVGDRAVYLFAPNGLRGSTLANRIEQYANTSMTARNGNTITKLLDMLA